MVRWDGGWKRRFPGVYARDDVDVVIAIAMLTVFEGEIEEGGRLHSA